MKISTVGRYRKDCRSVKFIHVKHFSGAKTQCMKDYLKHSLRKNPSHSILHVGTNDLKFEKPSKTIAKEIMNTAVSLKSEAHNVSVSKTS